LTKFSAPTVEQFQPPSTSRGNWQTIDPWAPVDKRRHDDCYHQKDNDPPRHLGQPRDEYPEQNLYIVQSRQIMVKKRRPFNGHIGQKI